MTPQAILKDCAPDQLAPTLRAMAGDQGLIPGASYRKLAADLMAAADDLDNGKIDQPTAVARGVGAWNKLDEDSLWLD